MNAIDLLKKDHDRVESLFEKFKRNEDGNNTALARQISGELETHTHIEETIFYPAAMKRGKAGLKKIIREGLEEHAQVKDLLADLSKMTARNKQFNAKLKVVVENVEHHVEEEEGEMFKLCEDQMSSKQLDQLGAEMEAEKQRFQKANGIRPAPEPKPKGVSAMVGRAVAAVEGLLTGPKKPAKQRRTASKANGAKARPDRSSARSNGKSNGRANAKTAKPEGKTSGTKPSRRKSTAKTKSKTTTRSRASTSR